MVYLDLNNGKIIVNMEETSPAEINAQDIPVEPTTLDDQNIIPEQKDDEIPTSNNPVDINVKKENFRKYLIEKGMMELLTKMLVGLYETNERPTDPEASFEYCRNFFSKLEGVDINIVRSEIERNKEKLKELNTTFEELNQELNGTDQ